MRSSASELILQRAVGRLAMLVSPRSLLLAAQPALLQWSHSSRPGHGVRTTNKDPAMPLKMYGMSNCWFSILASLLSRLPRGRTMLRLSAGHSESTRLAQAQGSGRKEVAVVDADVVFSLHFVSRSVFRDREF